MVNRIVALLLLGCCSLGCSKSNPETSVTTSNSSAPKSASSSAPASSKPLVAKKQGKVGHLKQDLRQLPGLDELYDAARAAGVGKDLPKTVQARAKDFSKMGAGERALEVGLFLASLAIVSLDDSKDVPLTVLEDAQKALQSLDPPDEIKRQSAALVADVKAGNLKGKQLRIALDRLIVQGVPLLEDSPQHQITARLLRLGAYLRVMSLVARDLGDTQDPKKLTVLSQGPDQEFHMETLKILTPELKKEVPVQKASEALTKLDPIITKETPAAKDPQEVSKILADYAR